MALAWRVACRCRRPPRRSVATVAASTDRTASWSAVLAAAASASTRPPRLYVPDSLTPSLTPGSTLTLDEGETKHARALRLAPGAAVELCDGRGGTVAASVVESPAPTGRRAAGALVTLTASPVTVPVDTTRPSWTLAVAGVAGGLKGGRGDWVVEKVAELGATSILPLATARAPGLSSSDGRGERWARLAHAASKQCLRTRSLDVRPGATLDAMLPAIAAAPLVLVAATGGVPVLDALAGARDALASAAGCESFLLVGPEGDWTPAELEALRDAGALPVGLGEARLRVETAALAILTAAVLRSE